MDHHSVRGATPSVDRGFGRSAGLVIAVLLVGYVTAPPVRVPAMVLPAAYDAETNALPAASPDRWWALYDDPQLASLVEHALANVLSAREAFARLDETPAVRAAALSRFAVQGNLEAKAEIQRTRTLNSIVIPGLPDGACAHRQLNPALRRLITKMLRYARNRRHNISGRRIYSTSRTEAVEIRRSAQCDACWRSQACSCRCSPIRFHAVTLTALPD